MTSAPLKLYVCYAVNLYERVSGHSTGRGDRGSHWRSIAEAALIDSVHSCVVLKVIQVDIDLQNLLHGRASIDEFLLDLVKHVLCMRRNVAGKMCSFAGDK